jgi:hypothetical protein
MVRSSFFVATNLGFGGQIEDWRVLLAIFPRRLPIDGKSTTG